MLIKAYLRASTKEQNAERAKNTLIEFAKNTANQRIAAFYIENVSGASLNRPELMRLLSESEKGDILLIESVDRLTRLNTDDWETLKAAINEKGIIVVSLDLPTSHMVFGQLPPNEFTGIFLKAINTMMLDVLAHTSRKEFTERERKQAEGIALAKAKGKYTGRQGNKDKYKAIIQHSRAQLSIAEIAKITGVSDRTVTRIRKKYQHLVMSDIDIKDIGELL